MSGSEFVEMIVEWAPAGPRPLQPGARHARRSSSSTSSMPSGARGPGRIALDEQEQTPIRSPEMDASQPARVSSCWPANQADVLDKALLRPGRFDRRVVVNLPTNRGAGDLKVHTRQVPLASE